MIHKDTGENEPLCGARSMKVSRKDSDVDCKDCIAEFSQDNLKYADLRLGFNTQKELDDFVDELNTRGIWWAIAPFEEQNA